MTDKETCKWQHDSEAFDMRKKTECGNYFLIVSYEGKHPEKDYEFCPHCGKPIEEVKNDR